MSSLDSVESWVYLFSRFSSEALLLELLGIFILTATYCAFWILRKRRIGTMKDTVPTGLVKIYLNELINEAHLIRTQLFGLLTGEDLQLPQKGVSFAATAAAPVAASAGSGDPARLQELESKLAAQVTETQKIEEQRKALESEITKLKEAGGGGEGGGGPDDDTLRKLKELEERLAEYSVIEDDLANLKRLQQENKKLKEALEGQGGAPPPADPPAPAPEPAAAATPEPEPEPPKEEAPPPAAEPEAPKEEPPAPEPEAAPESEPPKEEAAPPPEEPKAQESSEEKAAEKPEEKAEEKKEDFDKLEDTVQESIKEEAPAAAEAAPAEEKPAEEEKKEEEKKADGGDDDLLNEFERMLNM